MSTDNNGSGNQPSLGSSKDANELFATIEEGSKATDPSAASSSAESKLSGRIRDRYEGTDASHLTRSSTNNVEAAPTEPVNQAKFGYDPRNGTGSVRSGHLFRTCIPSDPRHMDRQQFPVAVGMCLRNCGTHCNQNPFNRECSGNPNVKFQNNQMTMTYTFTSPNE